MIDNVSFEINKGEVIVITEPEIISFDVEKRSPLFAPSGEKNVTNRPGYGCYLGY